MWPNTFHPGKHTSQVLHNQFLYCRPVYESGGSYRVEYLHVNFMPTPPIPTTTKKPEGGLFRKIFHKKAKKFQNVKNVASGFLSTFHL